MINESAANQGIFCRKIDHSVPLSIMPSNGSKAVFKAKSIMKTKSKVRISRGERNKENSTGNAQFRYDIKPPRKPASMLPKPSSRLSTNKNTRKGEFQKYAYDSKSRERSIPTKVMGRKGSVHTTSAKPAKNDPVSKTELLYQKARSALGKSKKNKTKTESSKPPLQKRRSEAVLEVMRKQERIRKNLSHKGSFCQSSSRNSKPNLLESRKSSRNTQERINKAKFSTKRSQVSVKNKEETSKEKHFKLSRKEARARIGLSSIPDEKIEEFVKVKKTKVKPQVIPEGKKSNRDPVPVFSYESRSKSRLNQDSTSKEQESDGTNKVKVRETLKIKFPEVPQAEDRRIVSTIESRYDQDLASSINDFDEFTPMYSKMTKQKLKKTTSKPKNPKITKEKSNIKSFGGKPPKSQENPLRKSEDKKELVRQQKKANYKKLKEEKDKRKERELKTKQNVEALNQFLTKKTQNYKKIKALNKEKEPEEDFPTKEALKAETLNRLTTQPSTRTSYRPPARPKKAVGDSNPNVILTNRRTYNPKGPSKKVIKKVINIPTVKMNKKKKAHNQSFHSKDESCEDSSHRKVVISKMSKVSKNSEKKASRSIKTKKTKKVRKNSPKKSQRVNHTSLNMNCNDDSIFNEHSVNKSYQQEYNFDHPITKNTLEDVQRNFDSESDYLNIHGEIELDPIKPENGVEEIQPQDWENIEMFSSKKFSDILKKHKKVIRYQESEFNEEQESLMDIQSNRKSTNNLQVTDICDDEKDFEQQKTYEKPLSRENFDGVLQPPQEFDKIRKASTHHIREVPNKEEMKVAELKTFQNQSRCPEIAANHVKEFSEGRASNKILTASINLLDKEIFSDEKPQEEEENKQEEEKDDSLWKPPNWNFGEPQKEGFFEGNVTSKRVIVDDLEDFQYDDPVPYDETGGSDHDALENVSVFEHETSEADPDQIPFNIEEDLPERDHEEKTYTDTQGEDKDTLKQMRILFGSEQRIREQSEAAIKHLNCEEPEQDQDSEPDEFQTPGLSQHDESNKISSRIFGKQSFQDFSRKKFQEIMFDGNMSEFMNSVERTVRETVGESKTYRKREEKAKNYTSFTPKKTSFASPRKFNRKELELDSIVGNKMKYMSEKKKARKSMLENYDSSLLKDFPQDPFNNSQEVYKAKFANYSAKKSNDIVSQRKSLDHKSGQGLEHPDHFDKPNYKVDIERTDQVFMKSKLQSSNEIKINSAQEPESIRRSNVRGLEVMISEKSQEMENSNHQLDRKEEDDNKTLKYELTEELTEQRSLERSSKNIDDSKSKDSPKDIMYDQLEKIMGNCFTNEKKDSIIDAQDYKTLKYAESDEANEEFNKDKESSNSETSSPTTAKRINRGPLTQPAAETPEEVFQKKSEVNTVITPRDSSSKNSYQTPEDHRNNLQNNIAQKEISKAMLQKSFESGRREDAFSLQFYSNSSHTEEQPEHREADNNEDNIRIYVDQWDGDNSEKKSEAMSIDPFNCTESMGIHTAKNSPFESNTKEKNSNMSEKYSVTEESGEKYLSSEAKIGGNAFDYKKPSLNNIRKNLHSTLQDNLNNSSNSFDFKDSLSAKSHSILKNTQSTIEINEEIKEVAEELANNTQNNPQFLHEYPHMVSPSENEIASPNYMEDNQCIVLSNKKCKEGDSGSAVMVYDVADEPENPEETNLNHEQQEISKKSEYVTDEILSMMLFSDIHDHCLFPYRTNQVLKEVKDKFPFNKPLGIKTNEEGVCEFIDQLINHIQSTFVPAEDYDFSPYQNIHKETYLDQVLKNLEKTVKIDPAIELAQLQVYEDSPQKSDIFEDIIPNEIFYSLEQERKAMYENICSEIKLTDEERNNKIHTTFIHDKMVFDSFNHGLSIVARRKIELPPWHFDTKALSNRKYSPGQALELLYKAKNLVLKWNDIGAGTNKIPPYTGPENSKIEDIFAPPPPVPTEEERNQQIREEKLSELLSKEINEEADNYEDCATQVKLDLADMILEDLAMEMANLLVTF
ncbi:unnamed protein product [Moneuplotes crassus]|uniref:DUF4378 domain-containing protein n=1 Tax=Euplotes crassus TaxID=5936 RepID=A0AAD1Y2Z3_EUPCR|nr:unnamed protein product [Moneuplotes crassus]